MQGVRPADEDRLPWLEPYRDLKRPTSPVPRRGKGGPLAFGAGIGLLLAVGAGGYWLGQRDDKPAPLAPSSTITLPAARPAPVEVAQAPTAEAEVAEPVAAETPRTTARKAAPARNTARHRPAPRKKIRNAGVEHAQLDAIRAQQEKRMQQERLALQRPWPKMPSPGPAGQVIQLGAFTTAARANAAYYQRIARYKGLAGLPKVVVPVVTRPDHRILYVLRLGTSSRQQSKTVCRNLRASGDHCLVIG